MGPEFLHATESVCPECLNRIAARLVSCDGAVYMEKECPEHGTFSSRVWSGVPSFETWIRAKIPYTGGCRLESDRGCPYDCGLCELHSQRTCTALVEVTSGCNLNCPVCFADSSGNEPDPDLDTLKKMFDTVMEQTGGCNLQLSGGEPTIRKDLPEIVRAAKAAGFSFIQLNSNGLCLAESRDLAAALGDAGLSSVFLQFDGVDDAANLVLRGRRLFERKCRAIEHIGAAGIGIVLVPTIVRGVNSDSLWPVVVFGLARLPHVRGVHFQPMSYFGRFPLDFEPDHVTLPEIMSGLSRQSGGMLDLDSFQPPGCEHALCSFSGRFLVHENGALQVLAANRCSCEPKPAEQGALRSISVTARQWGPVPQGDEQSDKGADDALSRFLERARTHVFSVSGMAFQDCWNLDLQRLRGCCIHVAQPDGRLIPFCSFNLTSRAGTSLHRPQRVSTKNCGC